MFLGYFLYIDFLLAHCSGNHVNNEVKGLKVWWHDATLFVYFSYFIAYIHSFDHIHTIHLSVTICRGLSPFPHRFVSSVGRPSLWCREWNSGLPYSKPTRYQLSHAAPSNWATPHHTEPRRTILSHAAPFWATPHHNNEVIPRFLMPGLF